MKIPLVLLILIAATKARSINDTECRIWIDYQDGDLKEPQPLILKDEEKPKFVLPNKNLLLIIRRNKTITFACPGENNGLRNFSSKPLIKTVCSGGKKFMVNGTSHYLSEFTCKVSPKEVIKISKKPCLGKYQNYKIGFNVASSYIPMLEICRDEQSLRTLYSLAKLVKELVGHQSNYPRPDWKIGSYYPGYDMKIIYTAASQTKTLEHILGSRNLAKSYIRSKDQQFLHRGHLAAKADFVFGAHQRATFWLLNTAPQWGSFNTGNWMIIERNVRDYCMTRKIDLDVYTGVHGITTLEDINGNMQPLFLHANEIHSSFPVPRYFWKVVYDPISKLGLAIVGLNEPYAKEITKDMYICPDIIDKKEAEWVSIGLFTSIMKGIIYVCTIESLREAVPTIPELEVSGLLP